MTPERRQKVKDLFHAAVERELSDRQGFLDEACGGDDELRSEVESLLSWDGKAATLVDRVEDAVASVVRRAKTDRPAVAGRRIGPYRILSQLGQGGLGTVYLAERADQQFRMRVAIKLARADVVTEDLLLRFRQERQILAHLDHPHIARLLDGGTTEDGLPYVVMEYIEGEHIDRYCGRRKLRVGERLDLFRRVCSAVQYAHRNLVIHRDIKPSNILVTGEGVPKLLDFGIAKLLDPALAPQALARTAAGLRPLTPEYASPEQIRGEPLTTATDVYSLGVLLYRLLTGQAPYRFPSRRPGDMERVICDAEPERPSSAIRAEAAGDREEPPFESPEKLRRRLRGDLDNIVLKAIRKEPERRYASAEQLAEDLRRHRELRPVLARPDTFRYRAHRFVERHRLRLLAALTVLLVMAALAGFYTHLLLQERDRAEQERDRAEQERDRAEQERDRAEAEAARKRQVLGFLTELFGELNPDEAKGEEISALELLARSADRIRDAADYRPDVRAEVMFEIGVVYFKLRDYPKAEALFLRSLDIRRRYFGERHVAVAESLDLLGEVRSYQAIIRNQPEKFELAERDVREALALRRELLDEDHEDLLTSLNNLAAIERRLGNLEEAESLFREVEAKRRQLLGPKDPSLGTTLHNLGSLLGEMGRFDEAFEYLQESLKIKLESIGRYHQDTADTLGKTARLHFQLGHFQEAVEGYAEVREILERLFGRTHVDVARAAARIAQSQAALGEREAAAAGYSEAVRILESVAPGDARIGRWREVLADLRREGVTSRDP